MTVGGGRPLRSSRAGRSLAPLAAALVAAIALVVAVAFGAESVGRPPGFFTREPSESLGAPWYTGFLALVGSLVWWTGAVVALAGVALLARRDRFRGFAPLLALGLLSAAFSLDDLLRIHEGFLLLSLGVPKPVTYGVYLLVAAAWVVGFRDFLRRTDWWLLALATVFLASSVAIDVTTSPPQPHIFEDGAKFVGIVVWTLYVVRTTHALVAPLASSGKASAPEAT